MHVYVDALMREGNTHPQYIHIYIYICPYIWGGEKVQTNERKDDIDDIYKVGEETWDR